MTYEVPDFTDALGKKIVKNSETFMVQVSTQ